MGPKTFDLLWQLRGSFGAGPFGKISQKLLALSFTDLGFTHIVERSVEGVDIDVAGERGKLALEVKTTEGSYFSLSAENIEGLYKRKRDGYVPVMAGLRLSVLDQWILAQVPLDELNPGQMAVHRLRAYRMSNLEPLIIPAFEQVVETHFYGTVKYGQQYLNEQLKKIGVEVRDS